jgi:hypothetical protein
MRPQEMARCVIDFVKMAGLMESHGFVNVNLNSEYLGIPFQLVAEGKVGLVKQTVIVSSLRELNQTEALRIAEIWNRLDNADKSHWRGKLFTYCIFADEVQQDAAGWLTKRVREIDRNQSQWVIGGIGALFVIEVTTKRARTYVNARRTGGFRKLVQVLKELLDVVPTDANTRAGAVN